MERIKEDYVSFETAGLLKEKGFQGKCTAMYTKEGILVRNNWNRTLVSEKRDFPLDAPSLHMAMKWLREVHDININISYDPIAYNAGDACYIVDVVLKGKGVYIGDWKSYEEACEMAIMHCLINLI